MQVIYHWAFAVAPALCPRAPSTLKSGWARAPPGYMAPAPLCDEAIRPGGPVAASPWRRLSNSSCTLHSILEAIDIRLVSYANCSIYQSLVLKQDAQLSQRDRAAGCVIVFAKSRRLKLGDNILQTL